MKKIIFLIVIFNLFISCQKEKIEIKKVRIGFPGSVNVLDGVAGIAQQKKFIENELKNIGYEVEYINFSGNGPAVNEALIGGKIDVAIYAEVPGIILKSKGIDNSLYAIADNHINAGIIVKKGSTIKSVSDLKGKKIAFPKGTYIHRFVIEILKRNGLSENDVEFLQISSDAESALLGGSVDAVAFTETFTERLTRDKGLTEIIADTEKNPDLAGKSIFVGNNNYTKKNPEAIEAVLKGLKKGVDFTFENEDEAYKILAESHNMNVNTVRKIYDFNKDNINKRYMINITPEIIFQLEQCKEFLLENNLITKDFSIEEWSDKSFYDKVF